MGIPFKNSDYKKTHTLLQLKFKILYVRNKTDFFSISKKNYTCKTGLFKQTYAYKASRQPVSTRQERFMVFL